jgi:hypothetical protein
MWENKSRHEFNEKELILKDSAIYFYNKYLEINHYNILSKSHIQTLKKY